MPTFLPKIPVTFAISLLRPAWLSRYWLESARTYVLALCAVPRGTRFFLPLTQGLRSGPNYSAPSRLSHFGGHRTRQRPTTNDQRLFMFLAKRFDLDIHTCGQIELHQRVHCQLRRL